MIFFIAGARDGRLECDAAGRALARRRLVARHQPAAAVITKVVALGALTDRRQHGVEADGALEARSDRLLRGEHPGGHRRRRKGPILNLARPLGAGRGHNMLLPRNALVGEYERR